MTHAHIRLFHVAFAAIVGTGALFVSDKVASIKSGVQITEAQAVIGRPLTPMSYAGVARRTTARAVVAAPVMVAPVVVAPAVRVVPVCGQVVNAYGQIATVCR